MGTGRKLGGGVPLGRFRAYRNALIFFRRGVPYFGRIRGGVPGIRPFFPVFPYMPVLYLYVDSVVAFSKG